jgi:hypothetical protein
MVILNILELGIVVIPNVLGCDFCQVIIVYIKIIKKKLKIIAKIGRNILLYPSVEPTMMTNDNKIDSDFVFLVFFTLF